MAKCQNIYITTKSAQCVAPGMVNSQWLELQHTVVYKFAKNWKTYAQLEALPLTVCSALCKNKRLHQLLKHLPLAADVCCRSQQQCTSLLQRSLAANKTAIRFASLVYTISECI